VANAWIIAPLPIASVTASSTAAGFAPANVGNDYSGVVWQSTGEATPTLKLDLGSDVSIDTIALFGLAGIAADKMLTIAIATAAQGSGFGAGAFSNFTAAPVLALAGSQMPTSGRGIGLYSVAAPMVGRHVLITFQGMTAAIQVARAVVGKRIQPERNFGFGGSFGVRDLGSLDFSARGVLLRRRAKKLRTAALTFSNINRDEVEAQTKPLLEKIGNTEMVAIVSDPSADPQRQNRCYFGPLVGELAHTQRNARGWEARINIVSIF